MLRRLWSWINERWPIAPLIRVLITEDIPGGASYFYSFGSSVLFVFILQAVTGICQLFFYVPTVDHAYTSLSYLRTQVPFGWLIHNLHYWGATAMIVLILLHMTRVFLWGAYKNPRQVTWLLGVFLFLLAMTMMFTGSPLPWDEKGYWATEVGTSIAGTVPLVGNFAKHLLRGGEAMGQLTLSRFFILHVALLSGLLGAFIGLHLVSFRRAGSVGPWKESRRTPAGPFWPDQVQKDLVFACVIFVALVALATLLPPPFAGQADPADTLYTPKPEWNFLFLYQALKLFPGKLEVVGTVGVPLLLVLVLLSVPFVDRRTERNPAKRPLALGIYFAFIIAAVILSIAGNASNPGAGPAHVHGPGGEVHAAAQPAPPTASPSSPGGSQASEAFQLVQKLGCLACHSINGTGGKVGPDLAGEKSRNRSAEWLDAQIRNPRSHISNTVMPSFDKLTPAEISTLVNYLLSLEPAKGQAAGAAPGQTPEAAPSAPEPQSQPAAQAKSPAPLAPELIGNAGHGHLLFDQYCLSCHGQDGKGGVPNPGSEDGTVPPLNPIDRELYDPDPDAFVSKIDTFLQHGSVPAGAAPALRMLNFGDSGTLSQEQISNLEAYVLSLNGVARARLARQGIEPRTFFALVVAFFIACGLLLGAVRLWLKRRASPTMKQSPSSGS